VIQSGHGHEIFRWQILCVVL
jgi:hypothetical protein